MKKGLGILLWWAAQAGAQNTDFSFLMTVRNSDFSVQSGNSRVSTQSTEVRLGWIVAAQIRERGPHRLYVEVPSLDAGSSSGTVSPGRVGTRGAIWAVTPGLRYQYTISPRWVVYGAGGLGFGRYSLSEVLQTANASSVESRRRTNLAVGYGGGVSFRLTKLLSLRTELRHYVLAGEVTGNRNAVSAAFGMALHF